MRSRSRIALADLDVFWEVARDGSVTGAARRLGRVQSNVSTRLKQMEERLETILFHRRTTGLVLTDEGKALLPFARRILDLASEAEAVVRDAQPFGPFAVGAMESTAAARLPPILSAFHRLHPRVSLSVVTGTAAELLEQLRNGEVEAVFVAEPIVEQDFDVVAVFTEALVLIGPPEVEPIRNSHDLADRTIIAFEDGCAYRAHLQQWLEGEGVRPNATLSVGSYLAMFACVAAGTGYAVVPRSVLDTVGSPVQFRKLALPAPYSNIRTLLVSRNGEQSVKIDCLRDVVGLGEGPARPKR
ncbi:MAG: LysR substrate-binding domain-containing protein [Pseudomonadota bacterium]